MPKPTYLKSALLFLFIAANFFVWQLLFSEENEADLLKVVFLDVGKGDAILIDDGEGNQVLIDGGSMSSGILDKLAQEIPFYDREIELLVMTHPDEDHYGGFFRVIESYQVKTLLWTGLNKEGQVFAQFLRLLNNSTINQKIMPSLKQVILANGAVLSFLWPREAVFGLKTEEINNYSLISRLDFGNFSALFTGDAENKQERELLANKIELKAIVLKVGHHGSKNATLPEFLTEVSPLLSIISVDKDNRYGHPHEETLRRLSGAMILRTDENGDIKILSDGRKMRILTQNP